MTIRTTSANRLKRATFAWLLLASCWPLLAATFTASLDRDRTSVGESVTLSLVFEGGSPTQMSQLPNLPGLRFQGPSQSSSYQVILGRVSSSITYSYEIVPLQAGEYTIPAFVAVVDKARLVSQPLKLVVDKATTTPTASTGDGLDRFAFLRLTLPKRQVYVGETFPVEIRLYIIAGNIERPELDSAGFTLGKMPEPGRTRTVVGNVEYNLVVYRLTASAAKTGTLQFGPAKCNVMLKVPATRRSRGNPFDDDFFGGFFAPPPVDVPKELQSETLAVEVLPLPATNTPAGFNGAVGQYGMLVTASPTNVAAGDPITVKILISGTGALDNVPAPKVDWNGFTTYPTTSTINTTDELGLAGTKLFEQVVVPNNTNVTRLPAISFAWFDPEQKAFRSQTQPPLALVVRPGAAAASPTVVATAKATSADKLPTKEIVHIKPRLGALAATSTPLVGRPSYFIVLAAPALAWLASLLWRRRRDSLANNPRLRRQRRVALIVRDGLKELRTLAEANDSDQFFALVFRLLQEQIGERLDLPASAITEAIIEERMRPRGVEESLLAALHDLFQACNQARYAPARSSGELVALLPAIQQALAELQTLHATT